MDNKLKTNSKLSLEEVQLKTVGRALKIARNDKKLLLLDVAKETGISSFTISRLERGILKNTTIQTLNTIAAIVDCKIYITVEQKGKHW